MYGGAARMAGIGMKKLIVISLLLVLLTSALAILFSRREVNMQSVTGEWVPDDDSAAYLDQHSLDRERFTSRLVLKGDGSFEAYQVPWTGNSPPWSGTGTWSLHTKATPDPNGHPMIYLESRTAPEGVGNWIHVRIDPLERERLCYRYGHSYYLRMDYRKAK